MGNLKLKIPNDVIKIHKAFKKSGKQLYVVGGAVRDAILGKTPKDFDLATNAKPEEVEKIAKDNGISSKPIGKAFGVVSLFINKVEYEIATFRKDIGSGRRPTSVDYTDIQGDVKRRDLTVNALFYDIDKKEIVDLVGGIADLKKKNIRTVGKAKERFDEDPLRKLRALRFWTRLGGTLDKELLDALQTDPSLKGVSGERIKDEFLKSIKSSKNTKEYMDMCDKIGFTSQILPNLKISNPYPKINDYILFLAWILRKNSPMVLSTILNKIKYTNDERDEIVYLNTLQDFKPENIVAYKKGQSKADNNRIITFGKMIGKDMNKFVKYKPSVTFKDVPKDLKGPAIGLWMNDKEKENYLNEGLKDLGITDFKSLFKKMPPQLQKRVYSLKNFGQRLDKHSEGNVLKHTIMVVNRSIKDDDIDIAIAAMFHDIGKDETAGIHPKKGHITHFGHEKVSAMLSKEYRKWIESVGGNAANVYYIVKNHMKFKQLDNMGIKKVMKLKAFRAFDKLSKFSKHDRGGLDESGKDKSEKNYADWKADNELDEGRPIPMDTPNELVYLDFKKYAYKNRSMFKRELIKNKDNGGKMFLTLSALWYKWARKDNKEFTHIKDKLKFGRALMIMMVKDNIVFSKDTWKKSGKITQLQEKEAERDYKDEYKKFQSSTKSKKYRAELNKYNRDKGTYGNGDGKDASHKGGKIVGFESASKNRGRAEKSRLKKKK